MTTDRRARMDRLGPLIAVLRAQSAAHVSGTVDAVVQAGLQALEITLTTPDALDLIRQARRRLPDAVSVGAGTVLDRAGAVAAIDAGAQFLVTPGTAPEVIRAARAADVTVICGALTPTEICSAWTDGAHAVKVFPARVFGPSYLTDLRGPFPDILLVPSGGIGPADVPEYMSAGAAAVSIGGGVLKPALDRGDFDRVRRDCLQILASLHDIHRAPAPDPGD